VKRQTNCVPALRFPFGDYVAEKRRVNYSSGFFDLMQLFHDTRLPTICVILMQRALLSGLV